MTVYVAAGTAGGSGSASVVNEYIDATAYGADSSGSADSASAINAALTAAANATGGAGGRVVLPSGSYKANSQISIPQYVTLMGNGWGTTSLFPGSDFGYGQFLIMPTGSIGMQCVRDLDIEGPHSSYTPHYGEVPCLMSAVNWAGGMTVRDCRINRFLRGIETNNPSTNGTDHARLENLRMNGNYVHLRFNKMVDTGNQIIRDLRTEQQTMAALSLASGAFLGGGSHVENFWNSFGPLGILFEDGTAGEAGILNTDFINMQFESLGHAAYYDERYVLWAGASSGHDYKYNRHVNCGSFGFPGGATIPANAIQFVDLGAATGGTFTLSLTYNSSTQTTATITPSTYTPSNGNFGNATDALAIQNALKALSNVPAPGSNPAGNIIVLPCFNGYRVIFQGAFYNAAPGLMTITSSLTGTGTSPRVVNAVPQGNWAMVLNGITLSNQFDRISDLAAPASAMTAVGGFYGGLLATNAQHNDFGDAATLIASQQNQGDGWQPIKIDNAASTGSQPNVCSTGIGFEDDKIPCEIAVVRTFSGSGHLIERGDVVAMVQEGGEPDDTGSAEQYGLAGAGTQDTQPWGVAMTDAYRASNAGDCVVIAKRGRLPVKTAVGTTIAAGNKVKPDGANPGCVVQAALTDSPTLGGARQASNATAVGGRTNGRAAIPGVVIELGISL